MKDCADSPKIGGQAFEFWTTLIEDETERMNKRKPCKNYIKNVFDNLLDILLQGISMVNFEYFEEELYTDEEEEWGHSLSASTALQRLTILAGVNVMQKVINFSA